MIGWSIDRKSPFITAVPLQIACTGVIRLLDNKNAFLVCPALVFSVGGSVLSESRHEHLPGSNGNNNAVNVNNNNDKKPSLMQRVGSMLMMIPLMMQVLSLPGAIASIKASLLKSLFIGKLALIIMIYNLIISFRPKSEVVVVNHQPKMPEHYDHYYSPYDGDDSGWFG
ncbi:hypothetical protein KQX54_019388 [Cotesia glomerata]|uniref:Uncharacterized protein n=1 Tax=Cotesia glomerata TaxID=32391 RepID=A0AAV7IBH5_COTGL|nr:hypothetical protein KQX54_019388 [Cotesia glomerata]